MEISTVIISVALSFGITAMMGFWLIPLLRRLKYGQTILDIGPSWHKKKQGIPTMGGLMFIAGITTAVLTGLWMQMNVPGSWMLSGSLREGMSVLLGLIMALAYGMVGFVDDYISVVKKRNLGLTPRQKLVMQFFIAILYLAGLYLAGDRSTVVLLPFMGQLDLGIAYYPMAVLGIVYLTNAVNFTDGVDGLCGSVTFAAALGFFSIATILGLQGMGMFAASLAGGCLGFLVWNFHPARIFMGDTGSMFLGGMVAALAFGLGIPVFLLFLGIIYIMEGLSVMIQVGWFKFSRRRTGTGRRLFKMSPIHHHFEMSGWSETKIVAVFTLAELAGCAVAIAAILRA